ncbi:hypothetical protein BZA77DRAFT_319145 [Pyronema omphalodes]|nr:hypothetical protein BZA77DRAFT_319145 [Pyronema omphalodes]
MKATFYTVLAISLSHLTYGAPTPKADGIDYSDRPHYPTHEDSYKHGYNGHDSHGDRDEVDYTGMKGKGHGDVDYTGMKPKHSYDEGDYTGMKEKGSHGGMGHGGMGGGDMEGHGKGALGILDAPLGLVTGLLGKREDKEYDDKKGQVWDHKGDDDDESHHQRDYYTDKLQHSGKDQHYKRDNGFDKLFLGGVLNGMDVDVKKREAVAGNIKGDHDKHDNHHDTDSDSDSDSDSDDEDDKHHGNHNRGNVDWSHGKKEGNVGWNHGGKDGHVNWNAGDGKGNVNWHKKRDEPHNGGVTWSSDGNHGGAGWNANHGFGNVHWNHNGESGSVDWMKWAAKRTLMGEG